MKLLEVKNLHVNYLSRNGKVKAVNGVNFNVSKGEVLGIVGESGCGKTTLAKALVRIIKPPCNIENGEIYLNGQNLLLLNHEEMRRIRLNKLSVIPQGSMNSLNPVKRISSQLSDGILAHDVSYTKKDIIVRINKLLEMVGLNKDISNKFPHELSGGMKQRVCIAMAVSLNPDLIIADEFTSALDVVVQRVVVQTLKKIVKDLNLSLISIGHNMGLQAQLADRVAIIYGGRIAEIGDVKNIYFDPLHPYTQVLIGSVPTIESHKKLKSIGGFPPSLLNPPSGCIFHPRCPNKKKECSEKIPMIKEIKPGRMVACHLY